MSNERTTIAKAIATNTRRTNSLALLAPRGDDVVLVLVLAAAEDDDDDDVLMLLLLLLLDTEAAIVSHRLRAVLAVAPKWKPINMMQREKVGSFRDVYHSPISAAYNITRSNAKPSGIKRNKRTSHKSCR